MQHLCEGSEISLWKPKVENVISRRWVASFLRQGPEAQKFVNIQTSKRAYQYGLPVILNHQFTSLPDYYDPTGCALGGASSPLNPTTPQNLASPNQSPDPLSKGSVSNDQLHHIICQGEDISRKHAAFERRKDEFAQYSQPFVAFHPAYGTNGVGRPE